jgi:hypothetical protein
MKKTIYLHIGSPKTGTTSIQKFIHDHAKELATHEFFVPPGLHAELPLSLLDEQHRKLKLRWPPYWPVIDKPCEQVWHEVVQQFVTSGCSKCIISAENFSELVDFLNPDGSDPYGARLRQFLSGFEIRVIVYLRPVSEHVQSMYKERIKTDAEIRSCENLLCSWQKSRRSYFYPSRYLDYYTGLFGKDNIQIRKYSRSAFPGGDIVPDFLNAISCPLPVAIATPLHENMSIPDQEVKLKRLFNVVGIEDTALNQTITRHLIRTHSVTMASAPRRECSFETLQSAIDAEIDNVLKKYGIDIRNGSTLRNLDALPASDANAFLISLLAHVIGQNENIRARLDRIESSLNGFNPQQ